MVARPPRLSPRIPTDLRDHHELRLPPEPASASRAREFVDRHCPKAGTLRDAARLLASELVTNVVLHARTPMTLGVATGDDAVLVTVADADDTIPAIATDHAEPSAEGGRGLALVRLLSDDYGVAQHAKGKTVWTLIREPRRGATQ